MLLFITTTLIFILFSIKYPDIMFWLAVTIFLDPGGYIQTYLTRSMLGGLQLTDLTFLLLIIPLFSPKVSIRYYFKFKDNRWIFYFLILYAIIYHVIVYGFITTGANTKSLLELLQYQRLTIWGFVAIIPAYIFFKRSYGLLIKFAFFSSILVATLYLATILTGISFIPIWSFSRGLETGAMRFAMLSYGYADWFIFISLIILIYKIKLPNKKSIYAIGLILAIAVVLTLTRRSIIGVIYSSFIIYFIHQRFVNQSLLSSKLNWIIFASGIVIFSILLIAPKYINYASDMIHSAFSIFASGKDQSGEIDARLTSDIPKHMLRFTKSPVWGYGWDKLWYSNKSEAGGLSANDVPLTAALGMYGIAGLFLFSFFYFKVFKIMIQIYRILYKSYLNGIAQRNAFLFVISLSLLVSFISQYTINFMGFFSDLIVGEKRVINMLYLGFMLASRDILFRKLSRSFHEKNRIVIKQ